MATRVIIDPITRIEGHLGLEVRIEYGRVADARVSGTLFRGFEIFLVDRDPRDAVPLTQRICGVCPVSHGICSVFALEAAGGIEPSSNARLVRNIIQGADFIHSHVLHFYQLAVPDYVKLPDIRPLNQGGGSDFRLPEKENDAVAGNYFRALEMRRRAHELLAVFGAKAPGTPVFVPGGVTGALDHGMIERGLRILDELSYFIENQYLADAFLLADTYDDWLEIGRGCGNLLSFGAFPLNNEENPGAPETFLQPGVWKDGRLESLDRQKVTEGVKYSWYADSGSRHPQAGETEPDPAKEAGYSWIKAPRYDGLVCEVGPLARMWVHGAAPVRDLGAKAFSVLGRHVARAVECSLIAQAMRGWLGRLVPGEPACVRGATPREGQGAGLTEAPRGALGHWITIREHRIQTYQCVTPTAWNASPRDDRGQMGPIEQALLGTPVTDPDHPTELLRVVRSFDPCTACAVHCISANSRRMLRC